MFWGRSFAGTLRSSEVVSLQSLLSSNAKRDRRKCARSAKREISGRQDRLQMESLTLVLVWVCALVHVCDKRMKEREGGVRESIRER